MAFKIKDIDDTQAPLLEHLIELRGRLLRCVMALGAAFCVCLYFADDIFAILVQPLTDAGTGSPWSREIMTRFSGSAPSTS